MGAALVLTLRYAAESFAFLKLAAIPLTTLRSLLLPGALISAAAPSAALIPGFLRYAVLAALLVCALLWSAFHVPDVLRPPLRRLAAMFSGRPRPGGGTE